MTNLVFGAAVQLGLKKTLSEQRPVGTLERLCLFRFQQEQCCFQWGRAPMIREARRWIVGWSGPDLKRHLGHQLRSPHLGAQSHQNYQRQKHQRA